MWESELYELKNFGNMWASILQHARKSLFSLIMTHILNCRLTGCPILLYLAEKYLKRNEFCLLLTLKKLSTLLFPLNWTIVPCCIVVSTVKPIHSCKWFQNAAATLLTGKQNRDHISPVLASFHQLTEKNWLWNLSVCLWSFAWSYSTVYFTVTLIQHPLGLLIRVSKGWLCF